MSNTRTLPVRLASNQFVRFLFAGGLAAAANFGSRFLYSLVVDFRIAVVLAFFTGLTAGYLLSKWLVFPNSRNSRRTEMGWFVVVNLLGLVQTWALSVYLAEYLLPDVLPAALASPVIVEGTAHLAGVMLPVFTSFLGHKYITFRE